MYTSSGGPLWTILRTIFMTPFAVLALGFFPLSSASQGIQGIDNTLPSVYLKYEGVARLSGGSDTVLLQLHNNTNLNINVSANFNTDSASAIEDGKFELPGGGSGTLLKLGSEVELCYDAEGLFMQKGYSMPTKSPTPRISDLRNSCSYRSNGKRDDDPYSMGYWIRSKEFIKFKVPAGLLKKGLKVYTEFRFPWEFSNGRVRLNEPKHRVYFFYFDVPSDK